MLSRRLLLAIQLFNVASIIIIGVFVLEIDWLVHGQLYDYGLQFNNQWSTPYWTYLGVVGGFLLVLLYTTAITSYSLLKNREVD